MLLLWTRHSRRPGLFVSAMEESLIFRRTTPAGNRKARRPRLSIATGKPWCLASSTHTAIWFHTAIVFVTLDMGPRNVSSVSDIQNIVKEAAHRLPPGTWIKGRGYNEFYLAEKRHPTRWDLDTVSSVHPVRITHRSGHAHLLNSLALQLVGILEETGDPPGV